MQLAKLFERQQPGDEIAFFHRRAFALEQQLAVPAEPGLDVALAGEAVGISRRRQWRALAFDRRSRVGRFGQGGVAGAAGKLSPGRGGFPGATGVVAGGRLAMAGIYVPGLFPWLLGTVWHLPLGPIAPSILLRLCVRRLWRVPGIKPLRSA